LFAGDLNCLAWPQDCAAFAVAPHAKQVKGRWVYSFVSANFAGLAAGCCWQAFPTFIGLPAVLLYDAYHKTNWRLNPGEC
jgi:hypothetical protein